MVKADKGTTVADGRLRDYYANGGGFLWVSLQGVNKGADTLLNYISELCRYGISSRYFRYTQIEADLRRMRTLDFSEESIDQVAARLEYNLTKAYLRYVLGQGFGFSNPTQLMNTFDVRESDSTHVRYSHLFDIPILHAGQQTVGAALMKVAQDSVAEYLHDIQPSSPLYSKLAQAYLETSDENKRKALIVNMERCRWRLKSYPHQQKKCVLVNLPSYRLRMVSPDSVTEMRIGCGASTTKTPLLTSKIHRMDVNPQWAVPRSIVNKDFMHHVGDSAWFMRHRYYVRNKKTGKSMPGYLAGREVLQSREYSVYQKGGRGNSLGRIIFRFDNNFSVFLHDTSTPSFFARDNRSVSHGCVRVERPYDLALFLLGEKAAKWADNLLYNIQSDTLRDKSKYIGSLKVQPQVPLYIIYYTAYPSVDGYLQFFPDIYGYDAHIYEYLAKKCLKSS